MNLEIKGIYADELGPGGAPDDLYHFSVPLRVEIGEKGQAGAEVFHFVAASPSALRGEVREGEFKLLRGYVLLAKFDWGVIRRSVENILNHARGYRDHDWAEAVEFISRYGRYDAENLHR